MNSLKFSKLSGYGFLLPYITLFSVFLMGPVIFGALLSFLRWEMLSPAPPEFVQFSNYKEAFTSDYFWKALWATIRFVILAVPITVAFALLISVGINAIPNKRQNFYRALAFLPGMITISVVGILWRWFFNSEFGLFNAILGNWGMKIPWLTSQTWAMKSIVFMTLWWTIGGPVVIFIAGLKQIPFQYYEAASIDGATAIQKFRHITLPLLKPILQFVLILNIIGSFQVFGQTFMVTRGGPELSTRVLVQYIYETAFRDYRMGYGAALSWILFAIIVVFSITYYKISQEKKNA